MLDISKKSPIFQVNQLYYCGPDFVFGNHRDDDIFFNIHLLFSNTHTHTYRKLHTRSHQKVNFFSQFTIIHFKQVFVV